MLIPKPTQWQYWAASVRLNWSIRVPVLLASLGLAVWHYLQARNPHTSFDLSVFLFVFLPMGVAWWMGLQLAVNIMIQQVLWAIFPHMAAEYREGDYVLVLSPKHRDKVLRVYSTWQHNSFRVDLGPEAAARYEDIFYPRHVLRAEPDLAPKNGSLSEDT